MSVTITTRTDVTPQEFVASLPPWARCHLVEVSNQAVGADDFAVNELALRLAVEPDDIDVYRIASAFERNASAYVGVTKPGVDASVPRRLLDRLLALLPTEVRDTPDAFGSSALVLGSGRAVRCRPMHDPNMYAVPPEHALAELDWPSVLALATAELRRVVEAPRD